MTNNYEKWLTKQIRAAHNLINYYKQEDKSMGAIECLIGVESALAAYENALAVYREYKEKKTIPLRARDMA